MCAEQRPRRLRLVTPRFGADVVGGAEAAMRGLGLHLARRGWDVEAWTTVAGDDLTWTAGFAPGSTHEDGISVRRFAVVTPPLRGTLRRVTRVTSTLPAPLRAERLRAVAQGPYSPGLVAALRTADPMPSVFSPYLFHPILFGLPVAAHPRILVPAAHDEPALRTRRVARAMDAADALWFHSAEERELVVRRVPRTVTTPWECGVVGIEPPAGIDRARFAARHGVAGPYLYYGGRASSAKGFDLLLAGVEALRVTHPEVTLVVSGEPAEAGGRPWVRSVGLLGDAERWDALAGASMVVVPSRLESLSLLALEAWSVGRPCLVNGTTPVLRGHLERGGGGIAFHSAAELAAAAARLLDDPAEARALGERGRAYVAATYRWELAEERLLRLLDVAGR